MATIEKEMEARYELMRAKKHAKEAVRLLSGSSPDQAQQAALALVDAADVAARELELRIQATIASRKRTK